MASSTTRPPDLAMIDLASPPPDMSVSTPCQPGGCRAVASGCANNHPCPCLALKTTDPDPTCPPEERVACLDDPCRDVVTASCNASGVCELN